jgi:hypothetical protein
MTVYLANEIHPVTYDAINNYMIPIQPIGRNPPLSQIIAGSINRDRFRECHKVTIDPRLQRRLPRGPLRRSRHPMTPATQVIPV